MAEKARRRPARSTAQNSLKQLEARLADLESQLKTLRTQTSGSVGAARAKLETLERHAADQIARAQTTLKESLDSITRTLAASKDTVELKASRLTRAVRAGVRAGTRAYRRRARG
jgi:predicted  nucleic acid-binding Zn-ribbon protein